MGCIHGYDNGDYCRECCAVSDAKQLREELEDARALLSRCQAVLGEIEWDGQGYCPACGKRCNPNAGRGRESSLETHAGGCELSALLREIPR